MLRDYQLICLDILIAMNKFCKEYNIRYYLVGGTLLGAVRHGGFIPWDDDIDIAMPRADYEKFLLLASEHLPQNYYIQTKRMENYPIHFTKVVDCRTQILEKSLKHKGIKSGVNLDVFPMDGAPDCKFLQVIHYYKIYFYKQIISGYYFSDYETKKKYKGFRRSVRLSFRKLTRVIPKSVMERIHCRIETLLQKFDYEQSRYVSNYLGAWGKREIWPHGCFGKGKNVIFEKREFVGVADPDLYLRTLYGDYMKLPPESERVSHHEIEIIQI